MKPDAPFAVFDIEALDWERFVVAQFVTSDGHEVRCDSADRLAREVERFPGRVFAHYGGRYDFFFLPRPKSLHLSGSGVLRAQVGRASLFDSWFLFQMSLEKLGKAVGLAKFAGKSDNIAGLTLTETAEHCLNDCHVLRKALALHRAWCLDFGHDAPRWPATAGGTAVYCLEAREREGVAMLRSEVPEIRDWLRQYECVTGGRVELWQVGRVRGPLHSYDINSSYPQSWCDGPLPMGPWSKVTQEDPSRLGVYRCRVRQSRAHLPVVAPDHRWRYDGEAWCTSEEIAVVRSVDGDVNIIEGWTSPRAADFGAHFARSLFAAKQRGDPWAKVGVNSGHGKMSQGILQTSYHERDGVLVQDLELTFPAWHQRPLVGAFLLARARLRLWQTLERLRADGWRVLYVDTDCVHTDCPPERFPGALGDGLGEWKHEAEADEAVYVAPKVYALKLSAAHAARHPKDGPLKMAAKGLPRRAVTWEALTWAAAGEKVPFHDESGLVSFRSQKGQWGPKRASKTRVLSRQTGGKRYGFDDRRRTETRLDYSDA